MGFFDFFTGKKDSGGGPIAVSTLPPWQEALGQNLSGWVQKYLQNYQPGRPYGGQRTVITPSVYEQAGLNELGSFLNTPVTGDLFSAAKGQVLDTLGGKYANPETSPFIQSMTRLAGQNLQDLITNARGQAGARGNYFSRSALRNEMDLAERTQNNTNALIGEFINNERARQMTAVPYAQSLEEYGGLTAPLERIRGTLLEGSLPRLLEQADLEAKYQDFVRQQSELGAVPGVGTSIFSRNVPMEFLEPTPNEPSGLNQILSVLGQTNFGGGGEFDPSNWKQWMNVAAKALPFILA